jgi:hypothetical protein
VISKRMVKKQQMRWSPHGAHLLLQLRVELNLVVAVLGGWRLGLIPVGVGVAKLEA